MPGVHIFYVFKGDHSTKVEGVVRCVLDILRADQDAKLLVFSLVILVVANDHRFEVR